MANKRRCRAERGEEGDDGRTDEADGADDVEPARTDEDSRRWKQAAVVTTEDNNPVTTINFINTAARDAKR